jgi:hypothetical protein
MSDMVNLKADIFDILKQQDNLQQQFRILEEKKQKLLKELAEEEAKAGGDKQ